MRINHESYQKYIAEINDRLHNQDLFSPILLNEKTFLFPLQSNKDEYLVISLNHECPLVYLLKENKFFTSLETPLFLKIKKSIGQINIQNIKLIEDDNIIIISVSPINEFNTNNISKLIVELVPKKPNLIIVDNNDIILDDCVDDNKRLISKNSKYNYPKKMESLNGDIEINESFLKAHFANELVKRKQERYHHFLKFVNGKIKLINRKIKAIENDVLVAKENLEYEQIANDMFCLDIPMKNHLDEIKVNDQIITLNKSKTYLENIESFYKKAKKAKETIARSKENINNSNKEIEAYQSLLIRFENANEKQADEIMNEIGLIKKKKETKETIFNRPYKLNYNGTIIYFGRNASQNDYLSFVMKLNREFTWLHIKDKSGAHLVICNEKPTNKELEIVSMISLLCSRVTTGEIVYTKKKNVRRGHVLGEAILKNHSTIKINYISEDAKILFESAEKVS